MQLFIDNDILLKLGSADLLQNLNEIFNVNNSSIFVLSTAKHYIARNKKLEQKYSKETLAKILETISGYSIIPDEYVDLDVFLRLSDIPNIDSGEQVLYSIRPPSKEFLILTGDKISIRSLYSNPAIKEIAEGLKNKIVCLEYLFLRLVVVEDFESFVIKIKEANYCGDNTTRFVFQQPAISIELARSGLISEFRDLENHTGNSLFKESIR
ncbi:MAG: hypothetical protein Q8S39_00935 [Ignavibacteria bacterium]|nr:hypothetical protein [Ignavibacteria bacterium]